MFEFDNIRKFLCNQKQIIEKLFSKKLFLEKEYYKRKQDIEESMREKTKRTQRT